MRLPSLLACLLAAAPALAYEEGIHQLLGQLSLPADLPAGLAGPLPEDADALRSAAWAAGASHPDAAVRDRFLARWPSAERLDDWAWKELLGLTPEARVVGIDLFPDLGADARAIAARAARVPDEDGRNRERFAHDAERRLRRDAWGRPLPADPAQLDMGRLTGLSSQAHAHYGLPRIAFSDSPEVLRAEPRRFAWPPSAQAFAADFAQVHTDLALASAALGTPGAAALAWTHLGAAQHYLADVANQIHTLQAIYPFFVDARVQSWKEEAITLGGLLRARPDFVDVGVAIVQNHHLFLEALWAKRVREAVAGQPVHPRVADGLAALGRGDPELEKALDSRGLDPRGAFGRAIAEEVVAASSLEGGEAYQAARDVASRRLSRSRQEFRDGDDPDADLARPPDPARLERFYEVQGRGFARAATALRRHARLFQEATAAASRSAEARAALRDEALRRLVADGLASLEAREARLAAWSPRPPPQAQVNWAAAVGTPAAAAAVLAAAWAAGRAVRRLWRRRSG
jgi:hypothetical protein